MRITLLFVPICIGTILFCGCNRSAVSLDYTNAKDEVPQLGNLIFRFSKPLVSDSLLNHWDSSQYVSFEPKIQGRFRWEHPDELVFSPEKPLTPATSYTANLESDLLEHSNFSSVAKSDKISFHTPALHLDNASTTWVMQDENGSIAIPQIDLYFNYPVNPNTLKEKLQVTTDGTAIGYTFQTLSSGNKISLRLLNFKMEDKDYDVAVSIDKGLTPDGGVNGLAEKTNTKVMIPSPFELRVNDVSTDNDGETGTIKVTTSQQVVAANLVSFIKFEPAVKFTVEVSDDGFTIRSDHFNIEKSYSLNISKGLRGRIGGTLRDAYFSDLAFGKLEPSISFANGKAVYLAETGLQNIEVKITSVPKLKIVVSKIYENNLLSAQRNGYEPRNEQNEGEGDYGDYNNSDATAGDIVFEQEIETKTLPKYGNSRIFHFDIKDKLPDFKGIYHVMIRSSTDYWVKDSRFISLSDIGLIAKEGEDKMLVFANSIRNASVMPGVNVVVYGANNQVLGMGSTNSDGVAEIAYSRKEPAGFRPAMVIAKTANDFNYLPFNTTRVNTSRFEVGGKHHNSTGLDAFIYPERDIYRPGEKINFSAIVRDRQWKSPGDIPVKMKFLLPNGKELKVFRKNLNDQGSVEGSIDLAASAITGSYSLELYTSNDVLLGTQAFRIEEFVPDRIKVTAKLDKAFLEPGDSSELNIHAVNFFGPPAAGRNYECEIQVKQRSFNPKNYGNYNFSLANQNSFFDKIVREGKTDDKGNASEPYEVKEVFKNMGLLQATFYATVFDETGRPVSKNTSVDIFTQKIFFGVADDGYWYHPMNQPARFPLIAMDKNERVLNNVNAQVQVVRHEYRTVLTKNGSYFRYESQEQDKLITSAAVAISGAQTTYSFVPRVPGDYEIRVSLPGSNNYVSQSFYSYGSWGNDNTSFEVSNEGHIDISFDKPSYLTGEKVKALFKAPFSGRMLVTMETDKVISYQYVDIDKRTASIELPVDANDIPNVYVTATLFKPHDLSEIPLTVAHGFESISVEEKDRKIDVDIVAQKTVRSKTHQKVTLKAAPNSLVTLAAVDNGVLQVSDFETPDPYHYFYAKRALEVGGYDIYPLLFPEIQPKLSSTGGDTESDMKKRVNPMPAKRFRIMSYWSGIKKADGKGEASFEFDIPQFSGEIRLMAVAYVDDHFGSKENKMTVADPLVLSTALPRFLSPKDTVDVPLTITNTTSKTATADAKLTVSGTAKIVGTDRQTVSIAANSEGRVMFHISAPQAIGVGTVHVDVTSMGEKFSDETEMSVRPTAPLQKLSGSGSVVGGTAQQLTIPTNDFIPSSVGYSLIVSKSPAVELTKYLAYLVQYPYGCTEQTVSSAFPQLYYGDMADMEHLNTNAKANANYNVQEAIRKIKMRQLYNGAVTLWDNEGTENWWCTVYAAHFLWEAKKAGYDVDKGLMETMLNYVNNHLRNRETILYHYNRDQHKKIVPKEVIYGLYVLSLAGRPNVSVMNYYKSNAQLLSLDCKYLLSAAYALSGDKKSFKDFLPTQFAGEESVAQTGGSFYSDIRDESIALDVLVDADPSNAQIPLMAKHVSEKLKQRYWYSTQELAFSFIALGKIAREAAKSNITGSVVVSGKSVATIGKADVRLTMQQLKGTDISVKTNGTGRLYYFWQAEGISTSGTYKEEDSYLKVRKKFFDRYGKLISGNSFTQNELVIVQVTLEKSFNTVVDNIVITDMLPAGFEIENPRTKEIPGMDWIKEESSPTALDVRDDRINFFVDARSNKQVYYYAVRAVSPGLYHMGPVSADAMYNGEYHSYSGARDIRVK